MYLYNCDVPFGKRGLFQTLLLIFRRERACEICTVERPRVLYQERPSPHQKKNKLKRVIETICAHVVPSAVCRASRLFVSILVVAAAPAGSFCRWNIVVTRVRSATIRNPNIRAE